MYFLFNYSIGILKCDDFLKFVKFTVLTTPRERLIF